MTITLTDMRESLKGRRQSEEAIYLFCDAWHTGPDSDLFKAKVELGFLLDRRQIRKLENNSDVLYCFCILETKFGPFIEAALQQVKLADVKEGDVLTADPHMPRIEKRWPHRVHKWQDRLCVVCDQGVNHIAILPLEADENGYVIGFRR